MDIVRHFLMSLHCAKLGLATIWLLAGCAMPANTARGLAEPLVALQPWAEFTEAMPASLSGSAETRNGEIKLLHPFAITARSSDVYLLDSGLRSILRYDPAQQTLAEFGNHAASTPARVYTATDLTVYVSDPVRGQVLHFARNGTPLPTLSSPGNMAHPVAVAENESDGNILVADSLHNQIIVFSRQGRMLAAFKPQRVTAIADMATGPRGIYILDPLARQVVMLGWDGMFRNAFGAADLIQPTTIAVSRDNLAFVGDNFDATIKIFRNNRLAAKIGNAELESVGTAQVSFGNIAALAVNEKMLYVVDSLNARVHIMLINSREQIRDRGK